MSDQHPGWEQIQCSECHGELFIRPAERQRSGGRAVVCLPCVVNRRHPVVAPVEPEIPAESEEEPVVDPEAERLARELAAIEARVWNPADGPDPDGMFGRWRERIAQ